MPRIAALLLITLAALVATATPAPDSKPWIAGWDKPIDPKGDCRFKREGERLIITVPGKGHELDVQKGVLNAPRLLRDVEGDFVVEVRLTVDNWTEAGSCLQGAGLMVTDGDKGKGTTLEWQDASFYCDKQWQSSSTRGWRVVYFQLERRGDRWRGRYSQDREKWYGLLRREKEEMKLPRKLKVGVFAEANVEGEFKAVFDRFKLSQFAK